MTQNAQILRCFLGGVATEETHERRQSFRKPVGAVATLTRVFEGEELSRLHVWVTNCSQGGVGLRGPVGLPSGSLHRLRIGSGPTESLLLRVVTSRRRDDEAYEIGATYA